MFVKSCQVDPNKSYVPHLYCAYRFLVFRALAKIYLKYGLIFLLKVCLTLTKLILDFLCLIIRYILNIYLSVCLLTAFHILHVALEKSNLCKT